MNLESESVSVSPPVLYAIGLYLLSLGLSHTANTIPAGQQAMASAHLFHLVQIVCINRYSVGAAYTGALSVCLVAEITEDVLLFSQR